jgi:hypothetical protein
MTGTVVDFVLVDLPELLHLGVGGGNGLVDSGIVAPIEPEDRSPHLRQPCSFR